MKKFFVAILSLLFIFTLTACGNETASDADGKAQASEVNGEEETVGMEETTELEEAVTEEVPREWENALGSARSYIRFMSFSYESLARQLEFEGFPSDAIDWAMEQMDKEVDWYEQAVLSAESYLRFSNFSKSGLVDQLLFDGFTDAQAQHGANVAFE